MSLKLRKGTDYVWKWNRSCTQELQLHGKKVFTHVDAIQYDRRLLIDFYCDVILEVSNIGSTSCTRIKLGYKTNKFNAVHENKQTTLHENKQTTVHGNNKRPGILRMSLWHKHLT